MPVFPWSKASPVYLTTMPSGVKIFDADQAFSIPLGGLRLKENVQVLVADDEPYILRSLTFVLQKEGYSYAVAKDGQETLAKARELQPAVVFLDIMMPKKSGFDVCKELKADPKLRKAHIIMLTAKGQEDDKDRGLASGADEYMTKPFSPRQVVARLKELLGGSK